MNAVTPLGHDGPCIDAALVQRAARTVKRLKENKLSIVMAESCTAGLICAVLSQAEGAGETLHGGFVVYSKDHKALALGVDRELLRVQGAVNQATADQMLAGALSHSPADLALVVTGVLGPDPDEDGNPVGLVFLAAGRRDGESRTVHHEYGKQSHNVLRRQVVLDALALLEELI